ncbi:MAG: zf-HC2 domain-containing protein [Oscillospiraceae bacterium]|nr:zf-HC2 domain-containing protein [Oscillospiraceae bacterium]
MNCTEFSGYLDDYIENSLPEDLSAQIAAHIAECDKCRKELEFARRINDVLHSMDKIEVSPDFLDKLNKRIDDEIISPENKNIFKRFDFRVFTGIAAAVIFAVIVSNTDLPDIGTSKNELDAQKSFLKSADNSINSENTEDSGAGTEEYPVSRNLDSQNPVSEDLVSENHTADTIRDADNMKKSVNEPNDGGYSDPENTETQKNFQADAQIITSKSALRKNDSETGGGSTQTESGREDTGNDLRADMQNNAPSVDNSADDANTGHSTEESAPAAMKQSQQQSRNIPEAQDSSSPSDLSKSANTENITAASGTSAYSVNVPTAGIPIGGSSPESDNSSGFGRSSGGSGSSSGGGSGRSSGSGGGGGSSSGAGNPNGSGISSGSGGGGGSISGAGNSLSAVSAPSQYTLSVSDKNAALKIAETYALTSSGNSFTVSRGDLQALFDLLTDNGITFTVSAKSDNGSDNVVIVIN